MKRYSDKAAALVREHVQPESDAAQLAKARRRFVDAATERPESRRRVWVLAVAVIAAVALAVGLLHKAPHSIRPNLAFTVAGAPGKIGAYVRGVGPELPVRFSDGSLVTMEPSARARVAKTTPDGASVHLESGSIRVHVVHRANTHWRFIAGPYTVQVTGTRFRLTWDPAGVLEIVMQSGAVLVHGPGADPGVEVRDRQRFTVETHARLDDTARAAAIESADPPVVRAGPAPPSPAESAIHTRPLIAPSATSARPKTESAPPPSASSAELAEAPTESWSRLVARGQYRRVLALAQARGIDATLSGGSVDDVSALADAARFSGQGGLAQRALLQLRSRFPGSARGVSAAFLLGRMADDGGNPSAALRWYDAYLREAPGGGLAAEALGRRMLALKHIGNITAANAAAQGYLKRFPNGPYAGVAREISSP